MTRSVATQFDGGRLGRSRFLCLSSSSRASSSAFGTAKTCLINSSNLARGTFGEPGLLLPKVFLPDQLAVGYPLADDARGCSDEPRRVRCFAGVEAIRCLVQVAVEVFGINRVVGSVDHPLEQRPEVLKPVRVDAIAHVAFRMVDDLMEGYVRD